MRYINVTLTLTKTYQKLSNTTAQLYVITGENREILCQNATLYTFDVKHFPLITLYIY